MTAWDTFELFETLLNGFGNALLKARGIAQEPQTPLRIAVAVEGFKLFQPASAWTVEHATFIQKHIETELSDEALGWYEECAPAVGTFSCFGLGALLGKFTKGDIDNAGFLLGEAHLPSFVSLNDERICSIYRSGPAGTA